MLETIRQIWKTRDLRNNILFVAGLLFVFRVLAHIPLPGIDQENLQNFFASNQLLGLINIFSGGGLENFSIVALGVGPYITSSIIFQLLTMVVPRLEELSKDGEYGRKVISKYTRWATVPLAILQGVALITLLKQTSQMPILPASMDTLTYVTLVATMTAGTILLMWIGEVISERKVGNGLSLLIFSGIVAALPSTASNTFLLLRAPGGGIEQTQLLTVIGFAIIAAITIFGIVYITEAQRNVPVSYAKRIRGSRVLGGVDTHLPLRVSQAGVIPIIFAISVLLFPPLVAQFFMNAETVWLANLAASTQRWFNNQTFYGILYFVLVFGFTYFYTFIIFQPDQVAENLQKQGGFIPGIRPGEPTAQHLSYIVTRIVGAGALFLGVIAVLPQIMQGVTGLTTLAIGGTSLLIVVSVVIESVNQIKAQLIMRDYEAY